MSAMKCYMSRPKHCTEILQVKLLEERAAVHNLRSPNKKHLKLNWSFQTLQTCLKNNTSTLVQNMIPNYMLFQFGSHRLFPIFSFRLPKWYEVVLPSHPKWVLQSSTVTPSSSSSRMSDVQMATAAKHKTNAACD